LGFTPTPYLTNARGTIVCGTFRRDLNPDAPEIVLPGVSKKHWGENAALLCAQRQSIPVFTKEAGLPWEYHGIFRGKRTPATPLKSVSISNGPGNETSGLPRFWFLQKEV
jgi:hypothetical protein